MLWDFFEHSLRAGFKGSALFFSQVGLGGLHHFWYGIILIVTTWFLYDYREKRKKTIIPGMRKLNDLEKI